MRNNKFIPVNSFDKALAFAPSIHPNFKNDQLIKSKPYTINTYDLLNPLMDSGWNIDGVAEKRKNKNGQVMQHFVKLTHPDLKINIKTKNECKSQLSISNKICGSSPLKMDLGVYRQICSNGMWGMDTAWENNITHSKHSFDNLPNIIYSTVSNINMFLDKLNKMANVDLSKDKMDDLAERAARLRFGKNVERHIIDQLLLVRRNEDKDNDLYTVYNRVQEGLTKNNILIDLQGKPLSGVNNINDDITINNQLFQLVEEYI
jgi:hypothetical protein